MLLERPAVFVELLNVTRVLPGQAASCISIRLTCVEDVEDICKSDKPSIIIIIILLLPLLPLPVYMADHGRLADHTPTTRRLHATSLDLTFT